MKYRSIRQLVKAMREKLTSPDAGGTVVLTFSDGGQAKIELGPGRDPVLAFRNQVIQNPDSPEALLLMRAERIEEPNGSCMLELAQAILLSPDDDPPEPAQKTALTPQDPPPPDNNLINLPAVGGVQ